MVIRVTRKLEANTQAQVLAIRQHTQKQEVGVVRRRRREHYLAATTKAPKQKARKPDESQSELAVNRSLSHLSVKGVLQRVRVSKTMLASWT